MSVPTLFARLCQVGNDLEALRDTQYHQGTLWCQLDDLLQALDAAIDTLVETPAGDSSAREEAREGWRTP